MIVVGYNDTPDCERALEWAASESRRSQEALRVVSATGMPTFADAGAGVMIDRSVIEEGAREMAANGVKRATELGAVEVEAVSALGNPAEVTDEKDDAAAKLAGFYPSLTGEWASDPAVRDIHAGLIADLDLNRPVLPNRYRSPAIIHDSRQLPSAIPTMSGARLPPVEDRFVHPLIIRST